MFKDNLRKLRKQSGLSQQELGNILNLSQSAIGNWETGNREPDFKTLIALSNFFNVSVEYLLGLTNSPASHERSIDSEALNSLLSTFFRSEFEGLTPDEIDVLASLALSLKELRTKTEQ